MRAQAVLAILVALAATAGCFSIDRLTGASVEPSKAEQMLQHVPGENVVPTGRTVEFDLYLFQMPAHEIYPGASMGMWAFSPDDNPAHASVPGPTIRATEGDRVIIHFHPAIAGYNHTIHFHGQDVPWTMDGVPFMSQKPVEAGQSFDYDFIAKPSGTYWYHCHVDPAHHIDMGMYGAMIVDPQDAHQDPHADKDFLLMLDDMDRFHLEGGQPATGNLPQSGDPAEYQQYLVRQGEDMLNRNPAVADKVTGTPVRANRNWTPVTYAPYSADYNTFLINGHSFPYTPTLVVHEGDIVRMRFVNVGNSLMTMHLHGHHMLVTHIDGVKLESPYWVDTAQIGPAQRVDVYVKMDNPGMWEMHDHIGMHTQNDNIFPGGAMTVLCYDSMEGCHDAGMGHSMRSGDLLNWRWNQLWQGLP